MTNGVYCIKDLMHVFWTPYCMPNDQMALRDFIAMVKSNDPRVVNCAPYLNLYKVGEFDDVTGAITPCIPEFIAAGANYAQIVAQKNEVESDQEEGEADV